MAVTICCIGKASDTAVSAFSEIRATNMESTMLYMAWIKKDIIIGRLILMSTLCTGSSAIMAMRSPLFTDLSAPLLWFHTGIIAYKWKKGKPSSTARK